MENLYKDSSKKSTTKSFTDSFLNISKIYLEISTNYYFWMYTRSSFRSVSKIKHEMLQKLLKELFRKVFKRFHKNFSKNSLRQSSNDFFKISSKISFRYYFEDFFGESSTDLLRSFSIVFFRKLSRVSLDVRWMIFIFTFCELQRARTWKILPSCWLTILRSVLRYTNAKMAVLFT